MSTKLSSGFSLVETIVAIAILSLSIAGTFTAVQSGIQASTVAKDQATAFYLVQEGMEFIKNIRDENALYEVANPTLPAKNWLTGILVDSNGISGPCDFGKTCIIDVPAKTIGIQPGNYSCSGGLGTCPRINQDISSGLFGYTQGWFPTTFRREIQFQSITVDEVRVLISVSWTSRGKTRSFQVTQSLFNRQ